MKAFVVRKKRVQNVIPAGSILYWSGTSSAVPAGWTLYNSSEDAFVMGTSTSEISRTVAGTSGHTHSYSSGTSSNGAHSHTATISLGMSDLLISVRSASSSVTTIGNHSHQTVTRSTNSNGAHTHAIADTGLASNLPLYRKYYLMKSSTETSIPIGAIALWFGAINDMPFGWGLCDGSNGRPDIRNRFIYVPSTLNTQPGTSGGSSSHTHTNPSTGIAGAHKHSVVLDRIYNPSGNAISNVDFDDYGATSRRPNQHNHGHDYSITVPEQPAHSHTMPGLSTIEIAPPWIKLFFIVKEM